MIIVNIIITIAFSINNIGNIRAALRVSNVNVYPVPSLNGIIDWIYFKISNASCRNSRIEC